MCQNQTHNHTTKIFSDNLLAIEMERYSWINQPISNRDGKILMNKPAYLGLSILEISKTVMYGFWYYYLKPKKWRKSKIMLHGYW